MSWAGQAILVLVFFLNTVPLIFVTLLANLDWVSLLPGSFLLGRTDG